jgi:quercetin dioxygenase-like cupin family protein
MVAGGFIACAFGGIAIEIVRATPGHGISSVVLTGPIELDEIDAIAEADEYRARIKTHGISDVYIVDSVIAPGGDTGWHSHPGISFVTIRSGTATEYQADDPTTPIVHAAGTGFVEEAGQVHIVVNNGDTDLELVIFQLLPSGAPRRIDEPAP